MKHVDDHPQTGDSFCETVGVLADMMFMIHDSSQISWHSLGASLCGEILTFSIKIWLDSNS